MAGTHTDTVTTTVPEDSCDDTMQVQETHNSIEKTNMLCIGIEIAMMIVSMPM